MGGWVGGGALYLNRFTSRASPRECYAILNATHVKCVESPPMYSRHNIKVKLKKCPFDGTREGGWGGGGGTTTL